MEKLIDFIENGLNYGNRRNNATAYLVGGNDYFQDVEVSFLNNHKWQHNELMKFCADNPEYLVLSCHPCTLATIIRTFTGSVKHDN